MICDQFDKVFFKTLKQLLGKDQCCACEGRGHDRKYNFCTFCNGTGEKNDAAISAVKGLYGI